jgi:hypothetical protein
MGRDHKYEDHWYLFPDADLVAPDPGARRNAAAKWAGMTVFASQDKSSRSKAFFEDAIGPGFSLPGCTLCVSETARRVLEPAVGDQAAFLPIEVVGAPMPYWILYVTRFYDGVDLRKSRLKVPSTAIADRRQELRDPVFLNSRQLEELYLFRVTGTHEFTPFALGDFATQRFLDLVVTQKLGGFSFLPVRAADPVPFDETKMIVTAGTRYQPAWA